MIQNFEGGAKLNSIHTSSRIIPYAKLQVKFFQFTQFQQASVPVYNCLSSIFIKNHPNFGRFLINLRSVLLKQNLKPTKFRFWSTPGAYDHVTTSFKSINEPKIKPRCIHKPEVASTSSEVKILYKVKIEQFRICIQYLHIDI